MSRPAVGEERDAVGRARRFALADGNGELWCFAEADRGLARRLVSFGEAGLSGFTALGEDAAGIWAVRRTPSKTADGLARGERLDGLSALAKVRDVANALVACEKRAVFPGALRPGEVALASAGRADAFVLADGWVRALAGASPGSAGASSAAPSPRWTPPEQAGGAPWDNAANRYVLGLVAYRLVAGEHPFSARFVGGGLREAMAAQAGTPPPFDDTIAGGLKPGIQSFVLAMIDPDPAKRPASSLAIVQRCEELLRDVRDVRDVAPPNAVRAAPAPRERAAPPSARKTMTRPSTAGPTRRLAAAIPIALGLALAGGGLAASRAPAPAPPPPKRVLSQRPLERTTAESCAPCHARQVAEWQRSVMAHAVKSPLFGSLESVVEEQVGRDARCPNGAGVLRRTGGDPCTDERTGRTLTGTGGEHWCVNCHSAADNLAPAVPAWNKDARATERPLRDVLGASAMEGISCAVCHQTIGPVHAGSAYQGNATWTSPVTGALFRTRPEDGSGVRGIGNSGYLLDANLLLEPSLGRGGAGDPIVHRRAPDDTARYLRSSEFCGACHDVRLFGTDSFGVRERGEHFKRLRNAYSEWKTWSDGEKAAGRPAATCQDCHMSLYPGVCVPGAGTEKEKAGDGCGAGFRFEPRAPASRARGMVAASSTEPRPLSSHWFTSVDLPLAADFPEAFAEDRALDANGVPLGLEARREQLLRHTFRFAIGGASRAGGRIEVPLEIQNTGAGHRVPAGFSQEREIWVEMTVKDGRGAVVYGVGAIPTDDADLPDKAFVRTTTRDDDVDFKGRPQGVFGADVVDGPDAPEWSPNPAFGGTTFRGRGLVNLQNGFLRCVRCIGFVDARGKCQAGPGQGRTRADRFDDGAYDLDTGECRSNLAGNDAFFETYFPVGALDASRGVAKAPDAILDQRSAAPGVVLRYTYDLDTSGRTGPFRIEARLRFRPFPPFLVRAFADYEARKAARGLRPGGPQVTLSMLRKNHPVDLAEASAIVD